LRIRTRSGSKWIETHSIHSLARRAGMSGVRSGILSLFTDNNERPDRLDLAIRVKITLRGGFVGILRRILGGNSPEMLKSARIPSNGLSESRKFG
jgi:hypothetical protein